MPNLVYKGDAPLDQWCHRLVYLHEMIGKEK